MAVALYRQSNGRILGTVAGLPVLLLTVAGRVSGLPRTTPLIYFEDGSAIVVLGSAFGATRDPDWAKNLAVAGAARVQLNKQQYAVSARKVVGVERSRLWDEVISPNLPSVEQHERASGRKFPVFVLSKS